MKLEKWALIAEIIGSAAIVVSLLYVGYELAQNTAEMRSANRQSVAGRVQEFSLSVATNPELAEIVDPEIDPYQLTPTQQSQLNAYFVAFFRNSEEAYLQYLDGMLSDEYWRTRAAITLTRTRDPSGAGAWYWENGKEFYSPRFVEWLDNELSRQ